MSHEVAQDPAGVASSQQGVPEARASKRQRCKEDSAGAATPPSTSAALLASVLSWSKRADGLETWPFGFCDSDTTEPATRLQAHGKTAVEYLERLATRRVDHVTKLRRELCKGDVSAATSGITSVAGAAVLGLAYAVPSTAVRSALAFAVTANAVTGLVRQHVGWHHLVLLEGPRISVTVELLDTGLRIKAIETSADRNPSMRLLHKRDLMQHRFDERCVTRAQVVGDFAVHAVTAEPAAKLSSYYSALDYQLLTWNCQHFADELIAAYSAYRVPVRT